MSWEQVSLSDTKLDKPAAVPAAQGVIFTLQPGAQYRINQYNGIQELNVRFDVSEGDFTGRPLFVSYPDPTAVSKAKADGTPGKPMTWSAQALKKLEIALGVDALPGEDPASYLNRVATQGNARVKGDILPGRSYIDSKTGEQKTEDPKLGIFTFSPAA